MTLLAAFNVLLHRYSGQNDISVGSVIAGRQQQETEDLIGFFTNTLTLRNDVSEDRTFVELLQQVKKTTLGAYEYQDVPFEKVVEAVVRDRDMSRSPLFQVTFVMQNNARAEVSEGSLEGLRLMQESAGHTMAKFDLGFSIEEGIAGIWGNVEYCTDLYREGTIARMVMHYNELLEAIVKDAAQKIGELPLLTLAEREQLLVDFNKTPVAYPKDKTVVELFEEQAIRTPEAMAVVYGRQSLTYQQLEERSNQLAHYLRAQGVGAETLVPICMERSVEMLIGILGILKAGGAYVPIDPAYPRDRIGYMLEDTAAALVVTSSGCMALLPQDVRCIALDRDRWLTDGQPVDPVDSRPAPGQLAYVIYTSGSTGRPKGVLVRHRPLY